MNVTLSMLLRVSRDNRDRVGFSLFNRARRIDYELWLALEVQERWM